MEEALDLSFDRLLMMMMIYIYIYNIERPRAVKQTYICKWERQASRALRVTFWRSTIFSKTAAGETKILLNMWTERSAMSVDVCRSRCCPSLR